MEIKKMKAVIVDIQGKEAAALCEDGTVRRLLKGTYSLGQTVVVEEEIYAPAVHCSGKTKKPGKRKTKRKSPGRSGMARIAAAAAACFLVIGISAGAVWAMPYGQVSMENGTSVTYTINRFDYVLDVKAEGADGEDVTGILDEKKIIHHKIEEAVNETQEQLSELHDPDGSGTEAAYVFSTDIPGKKHAEQLQGRLEEFSGKIMEEAPAQPASDIDPAPDMDESRPASQNTQEAEKAGSPERQTDGSEAAGRPEEPGNHAESLQDPAEDPKGTGNTAESENVPEENTEIPGQPADSGNKTGNTAESGGVPEGNTGIPGQDTDSGNTTGNTAEPGSVPEGNTGIPGQDADSGNKSGNTAESGYVPEESTEIPGQAGDGEEKETGNPAGSMEDRMEEPEGSGGPASAPEGEKSEPERSPAGAKREAGDPPGSMRQP